MREKYSYYCYTVAVPRNSKQTRIFPKQSWQNCQPNSENVVGRHWNISKHNGDYHWICAENMVWDTRAGKQTPKMSQAIGFIAHLFVYLFRCQFLIFLYLIRWSWANSREVFSGFESCCTASSSQQTEWRSSAQRFLTTFQSKPPNSDISIFSYQYLILYKWYHFSWF